MKETTSAQQATAVATVSSRHGQAQQSKRLTAQARPKPLLVPLNPRSELEPSKSNIQRCVSYTHDRVLRNLATTHALSQLHVQSIFAANRTGSFVHQLRFGRIHTLHLFLELR